MKKVLTLFLLFSMLMPLMAFKSKEIKLDSGTYLMVESDQLILYVGRLGGRLSRLYYKAGKQELVNIAGRAAFTEMDWEKSGTYDFLYKRGFSVMGEQKGNKYIVTCRGHHMGGGLNFLVVTKRYIIEKGSPILTVEYDFHNQDAAMTKVRYNLQVHTGLTLVGTGNPSYFMPGTNGIKKGNYWLHNPARGWMGTVAANGNGMAVTMSFPELHNFLIWGTVTMEWRYLPMDIDNGKSFKTSAQVIPFTGLPLVSGAGGGVAGALIHSEKSAAGTAIPVEIRVFDGYGKRKLDVELFCRNSGRKIFKSVSKAVIDFKKPGLGSCKMNVPGSSGSVELEAVIRDGKKELARLNSIVRVGDDKTPWSIDLLENKIKTDLRRPDITCFTHVEPDPDAVSWAKPLAGKKLKVLALGPKIPQLGDFTHRFDMEFNTCWIRQNGQGQLSGMSYLLGDFAGKATINDVIANLRKAVSKKYDVILIAGISWRILPPEVQKAILKQVSEGTGLVYTAVNEGHKFMKLTGKHNRTVKRNQVEAVKNSPLTSGVPLDFLPVERVFDLSGGEEVHALAGDKPYIVSARYGEGRIVGYCYYANVFFTGLIPCDEPEPHYIYNKPTPYEFFYAMLAKGMLYAAKRELPLKTENFVFKSNHTETSFSWNIVSSGKFEGTVEYFITDRHNEIREKGTRKVSFVPGNNKLELNIPVCEYGGKQLMSLIFRDGKKHSAGFGSWSFTLEPEAKITGVICDKKAYKDGEQINYEVKFSNLPADKTLRMELVDSFGRTLERKEGSPAEVRKGSFVLKNQLPSRYSKVRAYLVDNKKRVCDTGGAWFYTRPAEHLMKWDDYKVASIIYWDGPDSYFRMKRTAEAYRRFGLDILFNNWGLHRVLLGNFEPRMWALSGIGSQNFPSKEYLATGNKMLLARRNCLSDTARLEKYYARLAEKAKQGYEYGAIVYDNGDEVALSRAGSPVDFCFSKECLQEFRVFLKKRYDTLENLNRNWSTNFQGWDQVVPFTKEEVWKSKGKYIAGWADHREFMDYLCWDHLKKSRDVLKKYDPSARYMNSGTQYPNAYGGIDWWLLMQCHDSLQNYTTGDSDEIHRSFAGKEYASFPWYGYGSKGAPQVMRIWRSALLGSSGVSMWCVNEGVLFPDLTMQPGTVDSLPHMMKLKNGVGKLLMQVYLPVKAEVAILYSQPSLRASFIKRRMNEHTALWTKYIYMCRNMGAPFRFISYEQLANGELNRDPNLKLLVLGDSTALSDREIKEIKAFFARGGNVLAEGMPGTRYANCVKRPYPELKTMFIGSKGKAVLVDEPDTDYPTLIIGPDSKLNRKQLLSEQSFFRARMKKCGIPVRPFAMYHLDGTPVIEAMYFLRKAADGSWLGGIVSRNSTEKNVRIVLPVAGHTYDLVSGRYYGKVSEIKCKFSQGTPMALVVTPEKITMQRAIVSGNRVAVNLNNAVDSVVNIKVFDPKGKEVREYGTNLVVRKGKGSYSVPFAISDLPGKWELRLTEVISGSVQKVKMNMTAK